MAAARLCAAMRIVPLLLLLPMHGASAQIDDAGLKFATTEDVGGSGGEVPTFQPLAATVYAKVVEPTLSSKHLEDLPGFTRSVVKKDHALITPESQVFSGVPGWTNTLAAYFVTPAIGAHFTMMIAHMAGNSTAAPPSPGVERFIFVVTGEVSFKYEGKTTVLQVDSYAYSPADQSHEIHSAFGAAIVVIERKYTGAGRVGGRAPQFVVGANLQQPILPVAGEVFVLRKLLPQTEEYDFNIHIMDFQPGEYLNVKEVHYNQHGLLLLEGRGIYRLADSWYPVQAGDVIWMAPFVPQWYAALGRTKSRYLLYKDTNRDPLFY